MIKMNNEKIKNLETEQVGTLLAIYGSNMMCLCVVRVGNRLENWFYNEIEFVEEEVEL